MSIVVAPEFAESPDFEPLLNSLIEQHLTDWELVVASNRLTLGHDRVVKATVPEGATLATALNAGVAASAGSIICFLDATDNLHPNAISELCAVFDGNDEADIVYSDERVDGQPVALKPVFSPERLRSQFYFGSLTAYRRGLIDAVTGVRELPGAELYDLALRASTEARRVERLASVLVERRPRTGLDAVALDSTREALTQHLAATGGGHVESVGTDGVHRTHRAVSGQPLVSVIIPTRGDSANVRGSDRVMVVEAVRSVVDKTTYSNYEFVIVIDDVAPPSIRSQLEAIAPGKTRFVEWSGPFSFSGKMNLGVVHSRGELLLFLNDDVEVISPDWMSALIALAQLPKAGVAGAMLYFEDDTIQHAGHAYYRSDVTHIGLNSERGAAGPDQSFRVEREVDGATAACAVMPREVFFEAGGFTTLLPGNFNDVDLCMKVASLGYQAYWTPYAELYHYESKSRDPRVARYEVATAWGRWEHMFWESRYWPDDPHTLYAAT